MNALHKHLNGFLNGSQMLLLAILLGVVWGFWSSPLYDLDEGAFTEATREMIASGNYISIYLNGEPRHDKPILIYWLQAASVHAFGLNEFALRLPSVLASFGWLWLIFAFTRRHADLNTARVATLLLSLSLYVGLIAKAAVADALLNLFLAAAMFDIYSHFRAPQRGLHLRIFFWLGLGFLTKGPVAVFFPLLVSFGFYLSYGRWREWLRLAFDPVGLLIFIAIVLPWHVAVYLDTGWAFFEGFYLQHNVGRYNGAMEGHSGSPLYYVLVAPLIVLPFAGWFVSTIKSLFQSLDKPLYRYAGLWFFAVLLVFSFSGTKLPHYLLYGMSGVLVVMAIERERIGGAWLNGLPAIAVLVLFAALPQTFAWLAANTSRDYDRLMFDLGSQTFAGGPQIALLLALLLGVVVISLRLSIWRRMLLLGLIQAAAIATVVMPGVMGVLQDGPKAAGLFLKQQGREAVFNRAYQPSVSVYAEQVIAHAEPRPGQWVYVRSDKLDAFMQAPSDYQKRLVFSQGPANLVEITEPTGTEK